MNIHIKPFIDAWRKSTQRNPEAPHKAEAILTRMENNPDVTPNTIAYNSVMNLPDEMRLFRRTSNSSGGIW